MTTQLELSAPAPAPVGGRTWGQAVDLGVRAVLLLVIGVSALLVLPPRAASPRSAEAFTAALRSHRVSSLEYREKDRTVRWSEGWFHWYQVDVDQLAPSRPVDPHVFANASEVTQVGTDLTWLQGVLDTSGSRLRYRDVSDTASASWWDEVPWSPLRLLAGGACAAAFLLMLGRDHRRFASRWGWFWLFAIDGFLGPLLYLLLEPAPVWRRNPNDRPFPPRPAARGGVGFMVAIGLRTLLPWTLLLVWAGAHALWPIFP